MSPCKPRRACNWPNCNELVAIGRFCEHHAKEAAKKYEAYRETATVRGYDSRWNKVRDIKANKTPLCERCEAKGLTVLLDVVHHRDRNTRNLREENLESLCNACHDVEHKDERFRKKHAEI